MRNLAILSLASALTVATFLPLVPSTAWWIRALDIPRVQVAVAIGLALPFCLVLTDPWRALAVAALVGSLAFQLWKIFPYTPLAKPEMKLAAPSGDGQDVSFLAANILKENSRYDAVRSLIRSEDPDVLFLMETDARWIAEMEPVLADYPVVVRVPKDNYYGFVFATRLKALRAEAVMLTSSDTPTLFAELDAPNGQRFRFVGLHPRPPVPGEDTDERDAQILYAARFARQSDLPVVVLGDFNVAAWSRAARMFKRVGRYLDPRVGRGLYSSFDATHPILRAPIDQLHVTPDVAIVSFGRGGKIGSDHFPMITRLRFDAELAARLNRSPGVIPEAEAREIEARVDRYRTTLGHDKDRF
ncbi:MAG: endonuclease/exonuclease/phosphatase family protein [Paracoccaceae bacterium]